MKYAYTLHINQKEIEILNESLRMYRAHLERLKAERKWFYGEKTFHSYRNKVINMVKVMEDIKNAAKPTISEKGKFVEDTNVPQT